VKKIFKKKSINNYLFDKKKKFTRILFSEWIIEMDHQEFFQDDAPFIFINAEPKGNSNVVMHVNMKYTVLNE
jgi:hypothetical protein